MSCNVPPAVETLDDLPPNTKAPHIDGIADNIITSAPSVLALPSSLVGGQWQPSTSIGGLARDRADRNGFHSCC